MKDNKRFTWLVILVVAMSFALGFFIAKMAYAEEASLETPLTQVAPNLEVLEDVVVDETVPFVQASVTITSPNKEAMNLVTDSNVVPLEFTVSDATTCWYDLGGTDTYSLPNCAGTNLNLKYNTDYVLNLWASNGTETDPSQNALDSVMFKTPKAPIVEPEHHYSVSTGTCIELDKCGLNVLKLEPEVLGASKFIFTQDMFFGSKGSEVIELQKVVGVDTDGKFGKITKKAVKAYQTLKGLVSDGIVGPLTRAELNK